jgi:hypothetical protein
MLSWSIPVVAVSHSAHMEDAGFVLLLFGSHPCCTVSITYDEPMSFHFEISRKSQGCSRYEMIFSRRATLGQNSNPLSHLFCWRPRRDSNPCYRRERAVS